MLTPPRSAAPFMTLRRGRGKGYNERRTKKRTSCRWTCKTEADNRGQKKGHTSDYPYQSKRMVGRREVGQVSKAGKIVPPLHMLVRRGHTEADYAGGVMIISLFLQTGESSPLPSGRPDNRSMSASFPFASQDGLFCYMRARSDRGRRVQADAL